VNAERKRLELKNEMLSPREDVPDFSSFEALDADRAVARDAFHAPAGEWLELFSRQEQRRSFHGY
jgi:hypothetical protein